MQDLRETDGSAIHRKALRFHMAKCSGGGAPLHQQLHAEASAIYADLKTKERACEDAEDELVGASAEVDTAEIALENAIRGVDTALVTLDREDATKNARGAVFPRGFGEVIEPEGDKQLLVLPALHVRLEPYQNEPALVAPVAKLVAAEAAFKLALGAEDQAASAAAAAFEEERGARTKAREQLRSAHGRLRDLYKTRPALAEAFFMKLGRKEGRAKVPNEPGTPNGPGGGAPGGGGAPPVG
jgi:hypothetical protein